MKKNQYISVENVIAVGEIKSEATYGDLVDTFNKFNNLKRLKRQPGDYRRYFSNLTIASCETDHFSPKTNELDNIFTFFFSKTLPSDYNRIVNDLKSIFTEKHRYISLIQALDGKIIFYTRQKDEGLEVCLGPLSANYITYQEEFKNPFSFLLYNIIQRIQYGRCPVINYNKYLLSSITCFCANSKTFTL